MNLVVSGDYKGKPIVFIGIKKGIGIATSYFKRSEWIPLTPDTVARCKFVSIEPLKSKSLLRYSIEFRDGKKSLIELDDKYYNILRSKFV